MDIIDDYVSGAVFIYVDLPFMALNTANMIVRSLFKQWKHIILNFFKSFSESCVREPLSSNSRLCLTSYLIEGLL